MILLSVVFVDGMVTSSALFALVVSFLLWLHGDEPNVFGLLLLGNANWCVGFVALDGMGRLKRILEVGS